MPEGLTVLLLVVLALAVLFDYINGFHDTANAIATSVSTRALSPRVAIAMSAAANFVGALTGTAVAKTIGAGLITHQAEGGVVVAAALPCAVPGNLATWRHVLPSSRSHPLIGALRGAAPRAGAGPPAQGRGRGHWGRPGNHGQPGHAALPGA